MTATIGLTTHTNRYNTQRTWEAIGNSYTTGTLQTARHSWFLFENGSLVDSNHTGPIFSYVFGEANNGSEFDLVYQTLEYESSTLTEETISWTHACSGWDRTYYVSPTGLNSNNGQSASQAFKDIPTAFSSGNTYWSSNTRSVRILVENSATHLVTGSMHYPGSREGRWGIDAYGTGSSPAIIQLASDSEFITIGQGFNSTHVTLDWRNCLISGTSATNSTELVRVNANAGEASAQKSHSVVLENLELKNVGGIWGSAADNGNLSASQGSDGRSDYIAASNISLENCESYAVYHAGGQVPKYVHLDGFTVGNLNSSGTGTGIRCYCWQYVFFRDGLVYNHNADALRFLSANADTSIHARYFNFSGIGTYDGPYSFHITDAEGGSPTDEENRFQDFWFHSLRCNSTGASGSGVALGGYRQRLSVRSSWFRGTSVDLSENNTNNDTCEYLHIESNSWYYDSVGGGDGVGVRSSHTSAGTINNWNIQNNFIVINSGSASVNFFANGGTSISDSTLAKSDYNIFVNPGTVTILWYYGLSSGNKQLGDNVTGGTWMGDTAYDTNSRVGTGTHGYTAVGTASTADDYDFSISTSSTARNAGVRVYGADIDHDLLLRIATHDAGANDADATDGPELPNITTTVLTSSVSSYTCYRRFGYFHLRDSETTLGSVEEGWGEWYVERGGAILDSATCYKTMNFAWNGQDGDKIHVRYVDKAGYAGEFETYTFSVTGTYTAEKYVDASGGNDTTGSGTSGSPYATLAKAHTELIAALSSGQEGAIWVKEGQNHNYSSTVITSSSTARRIHLRRWGTSGSRPACVATSEVGFAAHGLRGAILIDDVDITGAHTTSYTVGISLERSGAGTRSPWDLMILNSEITAFRWGIFHDDNQWTEGTRDNGNWDFVSLENVTLGGCGEYNVYASNGVNKQSFRSCTFDPDAGSWSNPCRQYHAGDVFWWGCTMDTQDNGGFRFAQAVGGTSAGATRDVTVAKCTWTTGDGLSIEPDAGGASTGYCRRFRVVDCVFHEGRLSMKAESSPNMVDVQWLQIWDCSAVEAHSIGGHASMSETLTHVDIWNCANTNAYGGGAAVVSLMGDKGNWPDDSLTIRGCVGLFNTTDNPEPRYLLSASGMTVAELGAAIAFSNYNHLGKSDSDTLSWVAGSDDIPSRSTWNTATGHDANSTPTGTSQVTDFNWTSLTAPIDYRQDTSGGPLDGTGYTDGYSIDADGYVRNASTPDAGPYEYGASTEPDEPDIGNGAFTLSCDVSVYTLTRNNAQLKVNRTLSGQTRQYSVVRKDAVLIVARRLTGTKVSITVSGKNNTFRAGRKLSCSKATITVNGKNNTLKKAFKLYCDKRTYTVNRISANLLKQTKLYCSKASYVVNGKANNLLYNRKLISSNGVYLINGSSASLLKLGGSGILGETRVYTISGSSASLKANKLLYSTSTSTYTVSRKPAALLRQYFSGVLSPRIYTISGNVARLQKQFKSYGVCRAYTTTYKNSSLVRSYVLSCINNGYVINGQAANLAYTPNPDNVILIGNAGSYSVTGGTAFFLYTRRLACTNKTISINFDSADLVKNSELYCSGEHIAVSGGNATMFRRTPRTAKKGRFRLFY